MFDFYEKRKLRNILYSKPVLAMLAVIILLFSYSVWGAYQKEAETRGKWNQRASVLDELKDRESGLQTEIDRLDTPRGLEAEIRNKYEVAKDGEEVIVIVEPPDEEATTAPSEQKGFWARLFGL